MSSKALDPNLASILESIRATIGGDAVPGTEDDAGPPPGQKDAGGGQNSRATAQVTRNAARNSFAKSRTVEEFLADLTRPYVEAWLADHLPELVQKMVTEEIARLTGRG